MEYLKQNAPHTYLHSQMARCSEVPFCGPVLVLKLLRYWVGKKKKKKNFGCSSYRLEGEIPIKPLRTNGLTQILVGFSFRLVQGVEAVNEHIDTPLSTMIACDTVSTVPGIGQG